MQLKVQKGMQLKVKKVQYNRLYLILVINQHHYIMSMHMKKRQDIHFVQAFIHIILNTKKADITWDHLHNIPVSFTIVLLLNFSSTIILNIFQSHRQLCCKNLNKFSTSITVLPCRRYILTHIVFCYSEYIYVVFCCSI